MIYKYCNKKLASPADKSAKGSDTNLANKFDFKSASKQHR